MCSGSSGFLDGLLHQVFDLVIFHLCIFDCLLSSGTNRYLLIGFVHEFSQSRSADEVGQPCNSIGVLALEVNNAGECPPEWIELANKQGYEILIGCIPYEAVVQDQERERAFRATARLEVWSIVASSHNAMGAPACIRPMGEIVSTLSFNRRRLWFRNAPWHLEAIAFIILNFVIISIARLASEVIQWIGHYRGVLEIVPCLLWYFVWFSGFLKAPTPRGWFLQHRLFPHHKDKRSYSIVDLIKVIDHAGRVKPDLVGA